jgi:ribonucleotide reductase alpha subunit
MKLDVWNEEMKNKIIEHGGSIQKIEEIPDNIKELYKTVWETKQKHIIDQAGDRGPFVCQTQSMNLFFEEPTQNTLTSAFFYGWKKGLKTGCYYIRTRPKAQAQQFTIDAKKVNQQVQETNYKECEMCSA